MNFVKYFPCDCSSLNRIFLSFITGQWTYDDVKSTTDIKLISGLLPAFLASFVFGIAIFTHIKHTIRNIHTFSLSKNFAIKVQLLISIMATWSCDLVYAVHRMHTQATIWAPEEPTKKDVYDAIANWIITPSSTLWVKIHDMSEEKVQRYTAQSTWKLCQLRCLYEHMLVRVLCSLSRFVCFSWLI